MVFRIAEIFQSKFHQFKIKINIFLMIVYKYINYEGQLAYIDRKKRVSQVNTNV